MLVVIEHHSRRLIHFNVTAHPTAEWTRQQLREAVGYEERYAYLLHDRDTTFSAELDESIQRLGLRVSPGIDSKTFAPCRPRQYSADCITSTRWRRRDKIDSAKLRTVRLR